MRKQNSRIFTKSSVLNDLEGNAFSRFVKSLLFLLNLIKNYFLKFFLFLLSYVIPKDKKVLFFSSVGNYKFPLFADEKGYQFKESPKYLAIYTAKNIKNVKAYFHVPNRELFSEIETTGVIPVKGFLALWLMLRAKYVFVDSNNFLTLNASFLVGRFNIVQCWHGTTLKHLGVDRTKNKGFAFKFFYKFFELEFKKYLFFCAASEEAARVFRGAFKTQNVKVVGYPRNDVFFDKSLLHKDLDKSLRFTEYDKVIAYIPTYRDVENNKRPFTENGLKMLNKYLKENNYMFVLKKHPFDKSLPDFDDFSNIKDVSKEVSDLQELLVYTDVLITDYSSVFFDFCITGKPILYYPYDYEEYLSDCRDMYYDYYEEIIGPFVYNEKELIDSIKNIDIWFNDKGYKKKYNGLQKKFNKYIDGKSCERVMRALGL